MTHALTPRADREAIARVLREHLTIGYTHNRFNEALPYIDGVDDAIEDLLALGVLHPSREEATQAHGWRDSAWEMLRAANTERQLAWTEGKGDPGLLFHAVELGGEAGEVLNVAKKIVRERSGWRGSRATIADLAEELADVIICADKLAASEGIDLWPSVVAKFNATSEKVGLPHRLALGVLHPSREEEQGVPPEPAAIGAPSAPSETWRTMESAPKDGTIVWAYLYESGIRKVRWATPAECAADEGGDPEDYDGCWVEAHDFSEEWSPRWWAPLSALPPSPPSQESER